MSKVGEYFAAIGRTVKSLGDGFAVTLSYMFRKPYTIQYPDRSGAPVVTMLPERSRGLIEIDIEICSGCKACQRACPIDVISIEVEKIDGTRSSAQAARPSARTRTREETALRNMGAIHANQVVGRACARCSETERYRGRETGSQSTYFHIQFPLAG